VAPGGYQAVLGLEKHARTLALTDEVTRIGEHGVSDEVWEEVRSVWSEEVMGWTTYVTARWRSVPS
jgi:hypothetical protein